MLNQNPHRARIAWGILNIYPQAWILLFVMQEVPACPVIVGKLISSGCRVVPVRRAVAGKIGNGCFQYRIPLPLLHSGYYHL